MEVSKPLTTRQRRQLKKQEMAERKIKRTENEEKKRKLKEAGLCVYEGEVISFMEAGRRRGLYGIKGAVHGIEGAVHGVKGAFHGVHRIDHRSKGVVLGAGHGNGGTRHKGAKQRHKGVKRKKKKTKHGYKHEYNLGAEHEYEVAEKGLKETEGVKKD